MKAKIILLFILLTLMFLVENVVPVSYLSGDNDFQLDLVNTGFGVYAETVSDDNLNCVVKKQDTEYGKIEISAQIMTDEKEIKPGNSLKVKVTIKNGLFYIIKGTENRNGQIVETTSQRPLKLVKVRICNEIWVDHNSDTGKNSDPSFWCNYADQDKKDNDIPATGKYYRQCSAAKDIEYGGNGRTEYFEWPESVTAEWNDTAAAMPKARYMQKTYICMEGMRDEFNNELIKVSDKVKNYCKNLPAPGTIEACMGDSSQCDFLEKKKDGWKFPDKYKNPNDLFKWPEENAFCGIYCDTNFLVRRAEYQGELTCTHDAVKGKTYVGNPTTFTIIAKNLGTKSWKICEPKSGYAYKESDPEKSPKDFSDEECVRAGVGEEGSEYPYRLGFGGAVSPKGKGVTSGSIEWENEGDHTFFARLYQGNKPISKEVPCSGNNPIEVKSLAKDCGVLKGGYLSTSTSSGTTRTTYMSSKRVTSYNAVPFGGKIEKPPKELDGVTVWMQFYTDEDCDGKKEEALRESPFTLRMTNTKEYSFTSQLSTSDISYLWSSCVDRDLERTCCYVQEIGFCADAPDTCARGKPSTKTTGTTTATAEPTDDCMERNIGPRVSLTLRLSLRSVATPTGTATGTGVGTGTGGGGTGTQTASGTTTTTRTTTTTTTRTTTTTTEPLPQFYVNCSYCEVGQMCNCSQGGIVCTNGTWIAKNYQGTSIAEFSQYIPPASVNFTPNSTGKIEVVATCFEPIDRTASTVVEVKPEFMQCPSECSVNKECKCNVTGCSAGLFLVNITMGNPIPNQISLPINSTSFVGVFTPIGNGKVEATAACTNPIKMVKKTINITGYVQSGNFTSKGFSCVQITNGYRCTLSYDNKLGSDAKVLFLFSNIKGIVVASTGPYTVGQASADLDTTFSCADRHGFTFYASWNAYLASDTRLTNPVAHSKSTEVRMLPC